MAQKFDNTLVFKVLCMEQYFTRENKHRKNYSHLPLARKMFLNWGSRVDHKGRQVCARLFSTRPLSFWAEQHSPTKYCFQVVQEPKIRKAWVQGGLIAKGQVLWQIPGDFSVKAQWKFLCSLNTWELLPEIFTGSSCYCLGPIMTLNAWSRKAESWNSSTSDMHQSTGNQKTIQIYSRK